MTDNETKPIIDPAEEATDEEFAEALRAAQEASSVSETTSTGSSSVTALDSLQANEFAVELDGQPMPGVFRVAGLTTFRLAGGALEKPPVTLVKMVQREANLPFNQWLQATISAGTATERPTRTLSVLAMDDGVETRRWTLHGAYITEVRYTDFDTASGELVEETVTVHYERIVEAWTWSGQ